MHLIRDAAVLSAVFTAFVFTTLAWNPWLWYADYPAGVQALIAVPETPPVVQRVVAAILGLGATLATAIAICVQYRRRSNVRFRSVVVYAFLLFALVQLWDLLVIDWLVFATITPRFVVLPGTEGASGYHDYAFHLRVFLSRGPWVGTVVTALIVAGGAAAWERIGPGRALPGDPAARLVTDASRRDERPSSHPPPRTRD